ncbi:MAG TPA: hypothetical protein VK474_01500 [Chthoniobacterales bacterium]|nr:hypothetical protein [Chthoniobacterales bacterium]
MSDRPMIGRRVVVICRQTRMKIKFQSFRCVCGPRPKKVPAAFSMRRPNPIAISQKSRCNAPMSGTESVDCEKIQPDRREANQEQRRQTNRREEHPGNRADAGFDSIQANKNVKTGQANDHRQERAERHLRRRHEQLRPARERADNDPVKRHPEQAKRKKPQRKSGRAVVMQFVHDAAGMFEQGFENRGGMQRLRHRFEDEAARSSCLWDGWWDHSFVGLVLEKEMPRGVEDGFVEIAPQGIVA